MPAPSLCGAMDLSIAAYCGVLGYYSIGFDLVATHNVQEINTVVIHCIAEGSKLMVIGDSLHRSTFSRAHRTINILGDKL